MSLPARHFDALEFVKKSKELGVQEEVAVFQARQFENVVDLVKIVANEEINMRDLATKTDLMGAKSELRTEMQTFRVELKAEIQAVRTELKTEIQAVRTELKTEIQAVRTELKTEIQEVRSEMKLIEANLKNDIIKFTIWSGAGVIVTLSSLMISLMAIGFHWF